LGITIKTLYNKLHRYGVIQAGQAVPGLDPAQSSEYESVEQ
jgi:hypothetical protein